MDTPDVPEACTDTYKLLAGAPFTSGSSGFVLNPSTGAPGDFSKISAIVLDQTAGTANGDAGTAAFEWIATATVDMPDELVSALSDAGITSAVMETVAAKITTTDGLTVEYVSGIEIRGKLTTDQGSGDIGAFVPIALEASGDAAVADLPVVNPFKPFVMVPDDLGWGTVLGGYAILAGPQSDCGNIADCWSRQNCLYNQCVMRNYRDSQTDDRNCLATIGVSIVGGCLIGSFIGCLVGAGVGLVSYGVCIHYEDKKMTDHVGDCYQDWKDGMTGCGYVISGD